MRIITILFSFLLSAALYAQRTEKVEKTILYHADSHMTIEQAKLMAIEEAKAMAIDSVFGTNVHSTSLNVISVGGGKDVNEFVQISNTNVRGRWIKDIEEPRFGKIWYEENMLNIYVTVKGRVREIKSVPIPCQVKVLCNGTDERFETDDFRHGSSLYLSFSSPVDGYLVVYLIDEHHDAYRALPYFRQDAGAYPIKGNTEYVFFSEKRATEEDRPYVEEYTLTAEKETESNLLYVIFSPNKFSHPVDRFVDEEHPHQLSWKAFQSWLSNCMNHDDDMIGEIPIMLNISK